MAGYEQNAPIGRGSLCPGAGASAVNGGGVNYRGLWDANANNPALGDGGAGGSAGDYYVVSVAGTTSVDGHASWEVGDWIVHNGTTWDYVDNHPRLHAPTHGPAPAADPLKLDDLAPPDDNTDLDADLTKHGLLPKLSGGVANFLRGDGTWAAPPGGGGVSLTNTPPVNVTKAAAAIGISIEAARSDHKHDINTATASVQAPGDAATEGAATSLARSDHKHGMPATWPPNTHAPTHESGGGDPIKLDDLAAPDDNTDLDASIAKHGLLPKLGGGVFDYLRADGTWATPPGTTPLTFAPPVDVTKAAAATGVSGAAARSDHKHDVATAAPGAVGVATAASEGVATTLARSDHAHHSDTPPVDVTKAAAAIGTSGEPARADHKHDVATATASVQAAGDAATEGVATSLARSDHKHGLPATWPPSAHAPTHQSGGGDPIKLDDLAAPDDNTDLNASIASHGLLPKLGGGTTNYLRADGTWATPPDTGEANTASNVGAAGVGVFKQKVGVNLEFKKINTGSGKVTVSDDISNSEVDIDVVTAAPDAVGVATASSEGAADSLARSDHKHQSNTPPVNVTKTAAAIGTSGEPARADHKHDITTGVASVQAAGDAATEGVASSLARSDHKHGLPATWPPSAHAPTHWNGGSDPVKLDDLATPDDNTDLNASLTRHGLLPKLSGGTTNFLRGDGTWNAPPGGGGGGAESYISIPFSAGGASGSDPWARVKDMSYVVVARFIFRGTTILGTPISAKALLERVLAVDNYQVKIYDVTNGNTIAESAAQSTAGPLILDLGALSNLPAGDDNYWEIQVKTGNGTVRISEVQVRFS